jgi:quercetin dioxygenase-like cupin family protein
VTAGAQRVSAAGRVEGIVGSALAATTLRLVPGSSAPVGETDRDTLLFGWSGEAVFGLDGAEHLLTALTAALVPAGSTATLTTSKVEARVLCATVGGVDVELHAPMGPPDAVSELEAVEPGRATGSRSFQVLYGPHNGCVRATLFVGYIPPGRAPWHYHLYDEIVWVLRGRGRLHLRETAAEDVSEGCAFRLRPREVHIVENLAADEELVVLGFFTPAGSPSAAYLEPGVLAEYRIG